VCVVGGNFFRAPSSVPTTEHGEKAVALSSRDVLVRPVEHSDRQYFQEGARRGDAAAGSRAAGLPGARAGREFSAGEFLRGNRDEPRAAGGAGGVNRHAGKALNFQVRHEQRAHESTLRMDRGIDGCGPPRTSLAKPR